MHLFRNFLDDPNEYFEAEKVWRVKWEDLAKRLMQSESWITPWVETKFADGTPQRDGNPIFSAIDRSGHRAIRIVQMQKSAGPELSFWIDNFALGQSEAVQELVIACVLGDETLLQAIDLMTQWMAENRVSLTREGYRLIVPPIGRTQNGRRFNEAA
jgi:hypothetical protein